MLHFLGIAALVVIVAAVLARGGNGGAVERLHT